VITKCHILLVILIKIDQNILHKLRKKKKKKAKNEYSALSRSEVFAISDLEMWKPRLREVIDLLKLQLGNGPAGI